MDGHRTGVPQGPGEQDPAYRSAHCTHALGRRVLTDRSGPPLVLLVVRGRHGLDMDVPFVVGPHPCVADLEIVFEALSESGAHPCNLSPSARGGEAEECSSVPRLSDTVDVVAATRNRPSLHQAVLRDRAEVPVGSAMAPRCL